MVRKPLKKFKPTTSNKELEEIDSSNLWRDDHLIQVAKNSEATIYSKSKKLSQGSKYAASVNKVNSVDEDDDESKPDYLPEGFDRSKLPEFDKVLGWDKENPLLKTLKKTFSLAHQPSTWRNDGLVILEGKRLILEALEAGLEPETFVFSRLSLLAEFPLEKLQDCQIIQVPYRNISVWSELKTSPGFMASFHKRDIEDVAKNNSDQLPIHLVVDNIRMPDNLGALIRVAAAVGCKQVITMNGCSNIWNPKTLRSAAGAHLKVPIQSNVTWDVLHKHLPLNSQVIVADLAGSKTEDQPVSNVSEKIRKLDLASREFRYEDTESEVGGYKDFSYFEAELLESYKDIPLPAKPYNEMEVYRNRSGDEPHLIVVIGGETLGVSPEAYKFAHQNQGEKVYVPLMNNIESLNASSAASVILFEIQKKVLSMTDQNK